MQQTKKQKKLSSCIDCMTCIEISQFSGLSKVMNSLWQIQTTLISPQIEKNMVHVNSIVQEPIS